MYNRKTKSIYYICYIILYNTMLLCYIKLYKYKVIYKVL